MLKHTYPVRWTGTQAVVTLPEHIDTSNSGLIREQLLALVNLGAAVLVADMSATASCDHGGADALARVNQRASVSGTPVRVVVTAPIVRRVLEASGLDRMVSIYPSLEAAAAAGMPAHAVPLAARPPTARSGGRGSQLPDRQGLAITPAALWAMVDALDDGVVLTSGGGQILLANQRAEEMFGYARGDLIGQAVESLIPADLRAAHVAERAEYARQAAPRPMGTRARLVGQRKNGSTFPVRVSLSPVPTATGRFIMAVIRDVTDVQPRVDLGDLAWAAAATDPADRDSELLDRIVNSLYHVGLSLQDAIDLSHDVARQRIAEALRRLDDAIGEIRAHVFGSGSEDPGPGNGRR